MSDTQSEKQCRICLSGPEEEKSCGRLIRPCQCRGSMQYVHVNCLNKWRTESGSQSAFHRCDTCHYSYAFARTLVVDLATSPFFLGLTTAIIFTSMVFMASSLIIWLVPSLATPPRSSELRSFSQFITSPVKVTQVVLKYAIRTSETLTWSWWGYPDHEDFDDIPSDIFDDDSMGEVGFFTRLVHRFVLGLSAIGSTSFVTWIWQTSLFGTFRLRALRRTTQNRRDSTANVTTVLVLILILLGVARAMRNVYKMNRSIARRLLLRLENVILEVH